MGDVVRDILDKQLLDRHGQRIGRVDGLILDIRGNKPPRLAYIELGAVTLARRHGRFTSMNMKTLAVPFRTYS